MQDLEVLCIVRNEKIIGKSVLPNERIEIIKSDEEVIIRGGRKWKREASFRERELK